MMQPDEHLFFQKALEYYEKSLSIIRRYVKNEPDAEDLRQDVYIYLANLTLDERLRIKSLEAYVVLKSKHRALDWIKREKFRGTITTTSSLSPGTEAAAVAQEQPSAEDVIAAQQRQTGLKRAILSLPGRCREVFVRWLREEPIRQIAATLGISENTAKYHLARAVPRVQQALIDQESPDETDPLQPGERSDPTPKGGR